MNEAALGVITDQTTVKRGGRFKDKTGVRFGRLVALSAVEPYSKTFKWACRCDCGKMVNVLAKRLSTGRSKSCGCFQKSRASESRRTHGKSKTRAYQIWSGMITRCENPNATAYFRYGGRGIAVCERWRRFENFIADMGEPPIDASIERMNNSEGYNPRNCCWSNDFAQAANKRNNVRITIGGETHHFAAWARIKNFRTGTIYARIYRGWAMERALTEPLDVRCRHSAA